MELNSENIVENNNNTINKLIELRDKISEKSKNKDVFTRMHLKVLKLQVNGLRNNVNKNKEKFEIIEQAKETKKENYIELIEKNNELRKRLDDINKEEINVQKTINQYSEKIIEYEKEESKYIDIDKINEKIEKLKPKSLVEKEEKLSDEFSEKAMYENELEKQEKLLEKIQRRKNEVEKEREQLVKSYKKDDNKLKKEAKQEMALVNDSLFNRFKRGIVNTWDRVTKRKDKSEDKKEGFIARNRKKIAGILVGVGLLTGGGIAIKTNDSKTNDSKANDRKTEKTDDLLLTDWKKTLKADVEKGLAMETGEEEKEIDINIGTKATLEKGEYFYDFDGTKPTGFIEKLENGKVEINYIAVKDQEGSIKKLAIEKDKSTSIKSLEDKYENPDIWVHIKNENGDLGWMQLNDDLKKEFSKVEKDKNNAVEEKNR